MKKIYWLCGCVLVLLFYAWCFDLSIAEHVCLAGLVLMAWVGGAIGKE